MSWQTVMHSILRVDFCDTDSPTVMNVSMYQILHSVAPECQNVWFIMSDFLEGIEQTRRECSQVNQIESVVCQIDLPTEPNCQEKTRHRDAAPG